MVLDSTDELGLLELLQAVSDDFACALVVLRRAHAVPLLAAVVRLQGGHTDLTSDVELVSNGSSSGVEPVTVVWSEILEASGLHVCSPLHSVKGSDGLSKEGLSRGRTYVGDLELVALLKVLGESLNEFLSGNVLDGHGSTVVDSRKLNLYDLSSLFNLTSILSYLVLMLILNNKTLLLNPQIYIFHY